MPTIGRPLATKFTCEPLNLPRFYTFRRKVCRLPQGAAGRPAEIKRARLNGGNQR